MENTSGLVVLFPEKFRAPGRPVKYLLLKDQQEGMSMSCVWTKARSTLISVIKTV